MFDALPQVAAAIVVLALAMAVTRRIIQSVMDWLFKQMEKRLVAARSRREPVVFINGDPAPQFERVLVMRSHNDNA